MKIEINLDDKFFEEKMRNYRSASFSNCLDILKREAASITQRKIGRYPSFLLDSKILTHEFGKILNVKTPKLHQVDCRIEKIIFKKNTVIKPMYEHSSKGIFIYDSNKIKYLNKNLCFSDVKAAQKYAINLVNEGIVRRNKWMVEELIQGVDGHIARDVKFYCFYGLCCTKIS